MYKYGLDFFVTSPTYRGLDDFRRWKKVNIKEECLSLVVGRY